MGTQWIHIYIYIYMPIISKKWHMSMNCWEDLFAYWNIGQMSRIVGRLGAGVGIYVLPGESLDGDACLGRRPPFRGGGLCAASTFPNESSSEGAGALSGDVLGWDLRVDRTGLESAWEDVGRGWSASCLRRVQLESVGVSNLTSQGKSWLAFLGVGLFFGRSHAHNKAVSTD